MIAFVNQKSWTTDTVSFLELLIFEIVIFLVSYIYLPFPAPEFLSLMLKNKYQYSGNQESRWANEISFNLVGEMDINLKLKKKKNISNSGVRIFLRKKISSFIMKMQGNVPTVGCFIFSIRAWLVGFEDGCECWLSVFWKIYELSGLEGALMETHGKKLIA